ncbi:autotransporter domain-containing protein [Sphingomonas turrisvirgatae]|nr:autotransporter domain-containing protein [Sphingomonas turrisvirgatae]
MRRLRASLFLSATAILAVQPALADEADNALPRIDGSAALLEAHDTAMSINSADVLRESYKPGPTTIRIDPVAPEPEVLIANPGTPTTARDPVNINGIAQMVIDNGGGSVGLCTGTLINPRTVIFAAHCVNSRAATAYGSQQGGTPIAFGFETNTRANAAGETDELVRWLFGTGPNTAGRWQTNLAQSFFNVNWVAYNPLSLEPEAQSFLYGDVAMASLDTPAAGIPTWALLFSPLTNNGTIGAAGTGYNVGIAGYGNNGTGTTGASGSDFRRRAAENILGALTDLQTFEGFLFGGAPNGLTQNLYFLDFDDPRRGGLGASPFDFNAFRDNARPGVNGGPSREGITSQGDSGGPLILQNFAQQFVIGVLSGGYTRFFNGQPANGYGTVSFYQPLYLYWDWVAANNPYHYVAAKAGDGQWTDAARWETTLDPAYYVLNGNTPVNGIPGLTGEQKDGTSGDFGQICFQSGGVSDCLDTRTGVETVEARAIGTGGATTAENSAGSATAEEVAAGQAVTRDQLIPGAQPEAQAVAAALPAPTLGNGLPGASNFVPNNSLPLRPQGVKPQYFDVTLGQAGTTTLSGANIAIDRLTIATAGASLVVASGASLRTEINTNQFAGTNTVNGTFSTVGDYSLFGGTLLGSGTINAPFVSSVAGRFAPGTAGTIGTLTINGNLVMSSGTTYLVDLANGSSDLLAVRRVGGTGGTANLGGQLALSFTNALRASQSYTILTAEGGRTGTFAAPAAFSAILTPTLSYTANSVVLTVTAGSYTNVVPASNPIAYGFARLLDQNRSRASSFDSLYGPLDLQNAATILTTLSAQAPAIESTVQTVGIAAADSNSTFIRNRLNSLDPSELGGTFASYGRPVQVASLGFSPVGGNTIASDMAAPTMLQEGALPETMSAFVSGGYLNGDGRSMTAIGGRDDFDGWYIGGGIETQVGDNGLIGFAFSYTDLDGAASFAGQTVRSQAYQGTLYAKQVSDSGLVIEGQLTGGLLSTDSRRAISFLGTPTTLRANDRALIVSGEATIGKDFGTDMFAITPKVGIRNTHIGFGSAVESGGPTALNLTRQSFDSVQGRAGVTFAGKGAFRPFLTGTYVHEFLDQPNFVQANLVGGTPGGVFFALNGEDSDWGEVSGGLTFRTGSVDLSVAADTTVFRSDLSAQTYRGSVTFHF